MHSVRRLSSHMDLKKWTKLNYTRYRLCKELELSYDPYGPASSFISKPLMKVPYEGRTHLREWGRKKPYGPTTKAYGLACLNFKQICLQIDHMVKYLLTKLGRAG